MSSSNGAEDERTALLAPVSSGSMLNDAVDEEQQVNTGAASTSTKGESASNVGGNCEKPFPWSVVVSLYILTCITPLAFELIFPFVNQMILDNGITTDPKQVGFYSGFIESIFALTSFLSIMPCTYLADHLGRKPVILAGTFGLAVSLSLFGMAKTYWLMILTRMIGGSLGGTNAAMKVMLTEVVDKSQQALAFSGQTIAYRLGQIFGQPMGGLLAYPASNFELFDTPFWRKYPFSFPCFAASAIAVFAVVYGYLVIEETLPSLRKKKKPPTYGTVSSPASTDPVTVGHAKRVRPSMQSVLTPPVVGALISSAILAFSSEMLFAMYPLYAFTPIEDGGLGLSEAEIGAQLGFRSIVIIICVLIYAPLERKIGSMRSHQFAMAFWSLAVPFYPILNALARKGWKDTWTFQFLLLLFFMAWGIASLTWTSATIVINNSVPSVEALSVVHSVGQMAFTLPLAIAPAFITSVFAFSIEHEEILHGNLVYVIQLVIGLGGALHSLTLKEATHDWREDVKEHIEGEN
ncbi:MFS general substrate transporter [Fomitiporia mediterranea MF3/22]|uniref:MFS general substrate transporter n=1 Tax=Fomitiporia mediterranea (strain MF3/22) TaxID=694068 RepID=UPI000440861B|nr:MFS general substrate transporter [Fomitiporia mediterranea MF3/22]EJC98141.1 MFS general substrate transporter [Fomitiporia mediterranea MF3/22]